MTHEDVVLFTSRLEGEDRHKVIMTEVVSGLDYTAQIGRFTDDEDLLNRVSCPGNNVVAVVFLSSHESVGLVDRVREKNPRLILVVVNPESTEAAGYILSVLRQGIVPHSDK